MSYAQWSTVIIQSHSNVSTRYTEYFSA